MKKLVFFSESFEDKDIFINNSIKPNENENLRLKPTKSSNLVTNSIKNYDNIINNDDNENENNDNFEDLCYKKRNRIYSFSFLDTFKNRFKIDK